MGGRWPAADEQTRTEILRTRETRDQAVRAAEDRLLDLVDEKVSAGQITIAAAAGVIGMSRVPLSKKLNARGATGRRGGGRTGPPSADTRRELLEASERHERETSAAESELVEAIDAAILDRRVTVSAAAEILEVHRNTLNAALARHRATQ